MIANTIFSKYKCVNFINTHTTDKMIIKYERKLLFQKNLMIYSQQ